MSLPGTDSPSHPDALLTGVLSRKRFFDFTGSLEIATHPILSFKILGSPVGFRYWNSAPCHLSQLPRKRSKTVDRCLEQVGTTHSNKTMGPFIGSRRGRKNLLDHFLSWAVYANACSSDTIAQAIENNLSMVFSNALWSRGYYFALLAFISKMKWMKRKALCRSTLLSYVL